MDPNWNLHRDFTQVREKFPVAYKYPQITENNSYVERNTKYTGSQDYAFCLDAALRKHLDFKKRNSATTLDFSSTKSYVLMIEDDGIIFKDFFQNAVYILKNRVEMKYERDSFVKGPPWMDIKFFLPETWAGFGINWDTIWTLTIIGLLGATIFYSIYSVW